MTKSQFDNDKIVILSNHEKNFFHLKDFYSDIN